MSDPPLLEVKDLHVSLSADGAMIPVVSGVSFTLEPRRVLALVGESGCGKTVTANAIARLLPKELAITDGEMVFRPTDGTEPVDLARSDLPRRRLESIRGAQISMIFQEPMSSFSPVHTIGDQVGEPLRLHRRLAGREAREAVIKLLATVGISNPESAVDRYPHEFSGGMRQRAMIARALSCNPPLLIADEPTTALDVTIQAQIIQLMRALQAEFGAAIIFITHDLGVVAQIADDVAIMYTGRIIETGRARDIFHDPKHPYTVNLLRAIPTLGDLSKRRQLEPIRGNVPALFDMPSGCTFHPRCELRVDERCHRVFPGAIAVTPGHAVRCHAFEPKS